MTEISTKTDGLVPSSEEGNTLAHIGSESRSTSDALLQMAFIIKAFGTPLAQSGFDSTYPWRKTPNNWNGVDDWEIINRMQVLGIYASSECRRDPRTGTFANRFCHSDKDCCYTL